MQGHMKEPRQSSISVDSSPAEVEDRVLTLKRLRVATLSFSLGVMMILASSVMGRRRMTTGGSSICLKASVSRSSSPQLLADRSIVLSSQTRVTYSLLEAIVMVSSALMTEILQNQRLLFL